jgi:hypothetical protein
MRASELIQKLAEHIALYGDVPVVMFEDGAGDYEEVADTKHYSDFRDWKEAIVIGT